MKKISLLFSNIFIASFLLISQEASSQVLKEFLNSTEVPLTYLGIDFTQVKVLNEPVISAKEIKDSQFVRINNVIVNPKEAKKWDMGKVFDKSKVSNDISLVTEKNAKVDESKITGTGSDDIRLKKADVENVVKGYKISGKQGVGVMFIMETMNKGTETGAMYVALIDMSNGKLLLTERMTAKPSGFGFRNYWVKTVFVVLEEIRKSKMKEWKAANG